MRSQRIVFIGVTCALAVTAAVYLFFHLSGIGCPIQFVTGISCPGCGMTRALVSAVCLDIEAAFAYHPMWVAVLPTAVVLTVLKIKHKDKAALAVLAVFATALIATYAVRLILPDSTVVFEPENGYIYRLIAE